MDSVARYFEVFHELVRQKRWSTDVNVLRFAALTLAAADLNDPAAQLETTADVFRDRAGWSGRLNSPIRYVVAAMTLRKRLDAARVHDAVCETRREFRRLRFRRGGIPEALAALLLVLQSDGRRPRAITIERLGAIMNRWEQDHWFLTGADDYPMAALHAWRDEDVETLGGRVERIYKALRRERFSMGNALQLASHILALAPWDSAQAARRFTALRDALKQRGHRTWQTMYDELALLALTTGAPAQVVRALLSDMGRLREVRPRPNKSVAFSLAAGMSLSRESERQGSLEVSRDAAALAMAQALLDAQAAAMAACAASIAATTAAPASS